ncbi:MAG: protein-(glutamine-N5) methyltransferase [Bifidobacteriaceae bacterium]|nr:protein-(glutamine-N5) methyltransferase [Bifidobacteriaceae bacterium]
MTIKLGPKVLDHDETIPREFYGWDPDCTEEDSWRSGQGWWKIRAGRAIECDLAVVMNADCMIVAVARIKGLWKGDSRHLLEGDLLKGHKWLGKHVKRNNSQNPIAYFDQKEFEEEILY